VDAADVFDYASDPEMTRFVEWAPHQTVGESAEYIRRCLAQDTNWGTFAVEHSSRGKVIGAVDLRIVNKIWRVGEIGYSIARPYWGQGLNTDAGETLLRFAFEELHLRRVQALCDVANRRSYRTMEKLGMIRERVIARARYVRDVPVDRYCYSILRREWERRRRNGRSNGSSSRCA